MPTCERIYPNCNWTISTEWHGLNLSSALLTKVYWNYATDIIRVCFTAISPPTLKPNVTHKSIIPIRPSSKAIGSLFELLCHHSMQPLDPMLDELLFYLPALFPSHIFDYLVYERSDDNTHSSDSHISAFYSADSTYFL